MEKDDKVKFRYLNFLKENEDWRRYFESESYRSLGDIIHSQRMIYEDLKLEVERKKNFKTKLEEEK